MNSEEKIFEILSAIQSNLSTVQSNLSAVQSDLSTVKQDIVALDRKMDENYKTLDHKMNTGFMALNQKMDENYKTLDQKIDTLDYKINENHKTLDYKIDVLDHKVESGFKATRSELVEAIEIVGHKVDTLEGSIRDMETVTARNTFELQLIKGKTTKRPPAIQGKA